MNKFYQEAINTLVFRDKDHHRFLTAEDINICFNVVAMSARLPNRIPIICNNFEIAKRTVINNECDIYENDYGLVVIEGFYINKIYSSIYEEQYWYAWSKEEKYKAIERPKIMNNIVGFGMG